LFASGRKIRRGFFGWAALALTLGLLAGCAGSPAAGRGPGFLAARPPAASVVDITTRPGGSLRMLVMLPKRPRAIAVVLLGGDGVLDMDPLGRIRRGRGSYLVRASGLWLSMGLAVVLLDAPSDRPKGLGGGYRCGPEQDQDLAEAIGFLRSKYRLPVWLVGTGLGSVSAARAASRIKDSPPDGVVLGACVTRPNPSGCRLADEDLEKITAPVLVIHHREDACPWAPFEGARRAARRLRAASEVELLVVEGASDRGGPCGPDSRHGFWGMEEEVARAMARWMLRALPGGGGP
jgi:pimeloyl-ACP methyl ester carboxylesterase